MGYERNDRPYGGQQGGYGRGNEQGRDREGYGARGGYRSPRDHSRDDGGYDRGGYRGQGYGQGGQGYGQGQRDYRERHAERGSYYGDRDRDDDRGFFDRASDEVRSWFGDEEAERRRERDDRDEGRREQNMRGSDRAGWPGYGAGGGQRASWPGAQGSGRHDHDPGYRSWRDRQMEALDRDYDDYRRENQTRFDSEFGAWRQTRQGQRDQLGKVKEHAEVVGSDGAHIGTVDHVRGDRLLLTKTDKDAGGHHHSIPSSWIQSVEGDKVVVSKSADQAKQHWRDEERDGDDRSRGERDGRGGLNRSFSGTY